jgi:HK97 family phage major capsid protein
MAYNNLVSRTSGAALIPEQVSNDILGGLQNESASLTMFRQVQMSTNQTRMPVLSALPVAYFVNGDTGLKQTTQVDWSNKYLNVEELAAIVPIPENVLDDVQYDTWGAIMPLLRDAIARALDAAIFFGTNKPASWPTAIITDAVSAGNTVTRGTNAAAAGGIAGDFSDLFATVEADGFDVNGVIANVAYKGRLRQARATTGESLLSPGQTTATAVYGVDLAYPMRGLWPAAASGATEAIAGDFTQGILGIRKDITWKMLDQSVLQDNTGAIVYNLAQQDMVALRVTFRCAFQMANTLNYDNATATRYPFAVLRQA